MLNKKEIEFINSIENKIKIYGIKTTLQEVLSKASSVFIETTYNDKTKEIVDSGIEYYLCSKSPFYFIKNYCYISVPNMGIIPFNLYYFQEEILKEIEQYKKYIFTKTRQCLTEENFVMTNRGYISIKDVKIGDTVETLINGQIIFVKVEDWIDQGKKEICRILTNSGATIECTLDHKVFTKRGWVEAGQLTLNDEILSIISKEKPYKSNQSYEKIRKIQKVEGLYNVYDITTESSTFLANGLLVHNCGISTVTSFYCLWRALFNNSESIAIVSKKKDAAQDFISKMKVTLDYLPPFLKPKIINDNKSSIKFINESEIKSEARSPNAGRSSTLSLLVLDEAAFYGSADMAKQIVASAMPTLTRTGGSLIIVSTPSGQYGQGQYYFEQVQQMLLQGNTKTEKLVEIDWFEVPDMPNIYPHKGYNHILQKYIEKGYYNNPDLKKEMKKYFEPIEKNWKQNDWLKAQYDVLQEALFRQEILHDFVTMGSSVFNNELLQRVHSRIKEPVIMNTIGKSSYDGLWIWKAPIPNKRYILGVDCSSGTGSDYSTIQVLDVENYEQVCEYRGHISTPNFCVLLKKIANYYNQGYVVIESNSIGEAVFNGIYYDEYEPYRNVFKQERTRNNITRMTGWITDVKTRKLMVNEIIDWISVDELFDTLKLYSSRLYTEFTTWVWKENGKAEHTENSHDDLIMAFSLCLYNRNKAVSSGSSFLIDEEGKIINSSGKNQTEGTTIDLYGIVMDNDYETDFEKDHNMSMEQYKWLSS